MSLSPGLSNKVQYILTAQGAAKLRGIKVQDEKNCQFSFLRKHTLPKEVIWLATGFNFDLRPHNALINPSVFLQYHPIKFTRRAQPKNHTKITMLAINATMMRKLS